MQVVALTVAFVVVLVLVARRVHIGLSLTAGTGVMALLTLMPVADLAASVWLGLSDPNTVTLVLDVAVITALAGVLRRFGLLETMVASVTRLLGGARLAIMAVPSIIGALPVLGGAIMSAPLVDGLGDRLGMTSLRKAAVNLVFRHAWFFVAPFTPSLVLAAQLSGVGLGQLMLWQMPFAAIMLVGGWAVLLRGTALPSVGGTVPGSAGVRPAATDTAETATSATETAAGVDREATYATTGAAATAFLRSTSPLAVGVLLTIGLGPLRLPLYASVGLGLVLALALSRRHRDFRGWGLPTVWTSLQWSILFTMVAVMVFGQVMRDCGASDALVTWLVESGMPSWTLMVALPLAVGLVTGVPTVPVGVAIPALMPLAAPDQVLGTAVVLYASGFIAYFVSPVHLCQVLSSQYFSVSVARLYREYWPVTALLAAMVAVYLWMVFA